MADLEELIERVESGTGADRELDGKIARALSGSTDHWFPGPGGFMTEHTAPSYTASLDAVLALIEAKRSELPDISAADFLAGCIDEMMQRGWRPDEPNGPQICRAALSGLLRALKETQHDR